MKMLIFFFISVLMRRHEFVCSFVVYESKTIPFSEAFFIPISNRWFPEFSPGEPLEYTSSLLDMPDLPSWMHSQTKNSSNDAFLYGSAEELGTTYIEVVALNKNTFEIASRILELNVHSRSKVYEYEVEMKFSNMNVEDIFGSNRILRLIDIFQSHLWKASEDIYVTRVLSWLDVGGRVPLIPSTKEGVVVRIGGTTPFSRDLEDLEREVWPLRNRSPCPRDYKRTSAEHLFRNKNFIADWCRFRLIASREDTARSVSSTNGRSDQPSVSLSSEEYSPRPQDVPHRDFAFDFVVSVIIPTAVVGVISIFLTCIVFCSKDEEDKKEVTSNIPMNEYDSMELVQNSLQRQMEKSDESRSCTNSPMSTLPKNSTLRSSSHCGTLRMQPIPPPYMNSTIPIINSVGNSVMCPP